MLACKYLDITSFFEWVAPHVLGVYGDFHVFRYGKGISCRASVTQQGMIMISMSPNLSLV